VLVKIGCHFEHRAVEATPSLWQVRPRTDGPHRIVSETWVPPAPASAYVDSYGNVCDRLTLPSGLSTLRYDAVAEVPSEFDETDSTAAQLAIEELPDEAFVYLLPSRFCWPDMLYDQAWAMFGATAPGWARAQAVSDWVHANIRYQVGASTPMTTDIGVVPPDLPMDFCSWYEVWLGGRWWTFDPRNNEPRTGRVVIARGRDALDAAMVTVWGVAELEVMTVWADQFVGDHAAAVAAVAEVEVGDLADPDDSG